MIGPSSKLAIVLAAAGFSIPAQACRCTEPSIAAAYSRADAVARVIVTKVSTPSADGTSWAEANVKTSWKRKIPVFIHVVTGESCAYPLAAGQEYILYLYGNDSAYGTYRCRGNRNLSQSEPIQKWLERHGRKG